jgi:hypothetical protein
MASKRKTLTGNTVNITPVKKKTRQGNSKRSKPRGTRKLLKKQGR